MQKRFSNTTKKKNDSNKNISKNNSSIIIKNPTSITLTNTPKSTSKTTLKTTPKNISPNASKVTSKTTSKNTSKNQSQKSIKSKRTLHKKNKKHSLQKKELSLKKPFIFAIVLLLISVIEFFLNGQSTFFWISFVLSGLIIIPNLVWLKSGLGTIFGLPFIATMLKTKKFINTIYALSEKSKLLEWISITGLFLGFGLTGIDYWTARKKGGWKRILILLIGTIILYFVFEKGLSILFLPPAFQSLYWFCLIFFIILGFGGLSISILIGYGFLSILAFFSAKQICPSVFPVLPGVPIPGIGTIIPLIAWVSLGLILIIHEFSHGIMLARYKEKIHSVGLILFGIIPMGAFVEQDDKTFDKKSEREQLLVLSSGPSSNLFTMGIGIVLLLLFVFAMTPLNNQINDEFSKTYSGLMVNKVSDEVSMCGISAIAPAKNVLEENDVILSLNGVEINELNKLNQEFLKNNSLDFVVLRNGEELLLNTIQPIIFEDLNVKQIGVEFKAIPTGYKVATHLTIASIIIQSITNILFFFVILSFAVGMFNFLPSDPLDGGRIAKIVLNPYLSFLKMSKEDTMRLIGRLFAWVFLITILLNLLPYLTMLLF